MLQYIWNTICLNRSLVAGGGIFICGLVLGYLSHADNRSAVDEYFSAVPTITSCIDDLTTHQSVGLRPLEETIGLCYQHIREQGLLNDFLLRRLAFLQQNYADKVILWMVVILTLSGVLLAALQLGASYKLALAGKQEGFSDSHEMTVEKGKIVLRSSMAGVLILLISFAFFYIFIIYVYRIEQVQEDRHDPSNLVFVPDSLNVLFGAGEELGSGSLGNSSNHEGSPSDIAKKDSTTGPEQ